MRGAVVAVVVLVCACSGKQDEPGPRTVAEQAFLPKLTELLAVPAVNVNCTYVRGKVVVLDEATKKLDVAHILLPDALRATTPDEVGTVALVRSCVRTQQDEMFHDRTNGKMVRGFYQKCSITLVDRKRGVALSAFEVNGGMPLSGPVGKDLEGERPVADVAETIGQLTRVTMDSPGLSPVAYVQVAAPRRDITHQRKLDAQMTLLLEQVSKLVAERKDLEVVASHPNDGSTMYTIVPDVVGWKKTKTGVTCHATVRINDDLPLDESKHADVPADECLRKAAAELIDKAAARIAGDVAGASTVKCR